VTPESGQHLLHYRLVEKIGQGGMGSVWRAQDTTLDRDAAIKILPDELAKDSQFLARFEREAKLLASLNHPSLAAVFGVHDANSTRFLLSSIGGGDGLWRYRDGKPEEVWNGSDGARFEHPAAISPDGKRAAIVVREKTRARLYVILANGTDPRALMDDVEVAGAPCWSPDGEWVAVGGSMDGREGLFKVHVDGGKTERIHSLDATDPVWSPDGRMIVFAGAQIGPELRLHAVTPDGEQLDFPLIRVSVNGQRVRFLPDGSGIVYLRGLDPEYEFRLLNLESGRDRPLTKFASSSTMRAFDITPDGKTIVFDRQRDNSDIVLIERDVAR